MKTHLTNLLALFLLITVAAVLAFGQAETGQLLGTVTDPSGAVVANAKVTATNAQTGFVRTAPTNSSGVYTFTNLTPGTYEVTIEASGFTAVKQRVQVSVGGRQTLDAKLVVTGAGTTVEVTAEGVTQVNTTDGTLSQVVSQAQIQQLPTLTRNPYDLVQLTGNVAAAPATGATVPRGVGFAINGNREASTNILLDGGENVDTFTADVGQTIPLDTVQEFRVVTSAYTAEYGRASGGVVNVATRSGTNNFHGSIYEFNRISALSSNTYQESATNQALVAAGEPRNPHDRFVRNQFGYFIGGPIKKNKLFFSSGTEWTRVRSNGQQFALIIDPAFLAQSAPNTQRFFQTFGSKLVPNARITGTLTQPGFSGPVFDQVTYQVPSNAGAGDPQNQWSTVNRFDFNMTDKTTIWGRYGGQNQDLFSGTNFFSPFDGYNTGSTNFNQNILFNITHVFSPAVVNQFKAVYNRLNNNQPLGVNPVGPTLYLGQLNVATTVAGTQVALPGYFPFTPGNAIPFGGPQNLYQFYDDIAWTKGNHQLRFGGNYIQIRDNRLFGAYENAVENLGNNSTSQGLNNLLAGQLFQFQGAVDPQGKFPCFRNLTTGQLDRTPSCQVTTPLSEPNFTRNNRFNDFAIYGQDTWKASKKLTLSLGVRWEYYGVQHNANPNIESNLYFLPDTNPFNRIRTSFVATTPNSPIGGLWNQNWGNVAPRIGFAYDPGGNGKMAIRGGYGISYERNFGNVTYNVIQNPPAYAVVSVQAGPGRDVAALPIVNDNTGPLAGSGLSVALPPTSLRAVDPNIKTAYAHQYSLALEKELVPNTVMAIEYSGSRGIHQYGISNINGTSYGQVYLGDTRGCSGTGAAATCTASNRLQNQYTNVNFRNSNGDSYYNGVNVRVQSSNFRNSGLQLTANYTYSHAIDNLSSTFSEYGNNFNLGFLDPFNPGLDRGNADFDTRHRFVFSAFYEPTYTVFKGKYGILPALLGGWQFAPIFSVRTGSPFTIWDCTSIANRCPRIEDVAGMQKSGGTNVPVGPNLFNYLPIPGNSGNIYLNPAVGFSDLPICATPGIANGQCQLQPAQAGIARNSFFGPNFWSFDFGFYKNFKITERAGLQFRGEFFNILNHHNFYVAGQNADFSSATTIQTLKGAQGGAGVTTGVSGANDERRNIQLGLKLNF